MDENKFIFESRIVGDIIPKEYIPGVRKGLVIDNYKWSCTWISNYKIKNYSYRLGIS